MCVTCHVHVILLLEQHKHRSMHHELYASAARTGPVVRAWGSNKACMLRSWHEVVAYRGMHAIDACGLTQQCSDLADSHVEAQVIDCTFGVAIRCPEVLAQVPDSHGCAA